MRYNMVSKYKGYDMQVLAYDTKWTEQRNGYYQSTTLVSGKRRWLHQYTWEQYNDEIQPEGYSVHHIDHNKSNNDISNLELISHSEHRKHHGFGGDRDKMVKHLASIRHLTKAYHSSTEGREWHRKHYEDTKDKLQVKAEFVCEQCGDKYVGVINGKNRFCSNKCMSKHRRDSGVDNEMRECNVCGTMFEINKYSKTKTCSRVCATKLRLKGL